MKTYTYEEAMAASLEYFKGDELAASVWINKYAMKDSFGNLYEKSPEEMHKRLAAEFARIEERYPNPMSAEEILELLRNFKYVVPQGGPMTGIGNNHQIASLSNCFVIGHKKPADSYGGIMRIDEEQVQLMKRRGGVGHDLSHIRPAGSPVLNSALTSTGVVPFMERYSNSTREVAQDGRRGALMLSISVKHPDSENFIDAKLEQGKVTGANVSVKIDDEFMRSALHGKTYRQQYPIESEDPKYVKDIDASKLWKKIIYNAWRSAEPGILFWDTIIRESIPDCYADLGYKTVSTNPCGEIPLCPYDSCRLMAINLYSYVENPFTDKAKFNMELFKDHVRKAMRLMDDLIDLEMEKIEQIILKIASDPEEEDVKQAELSLWNKIREKTLGGRRTGLGITAEGDMLAALGLIYGTDNAIDFSVEVQKTLAVEAYRSSTIMAQERGSFPIFEASREVNNPMIARLRKEDEELFESMQRHGRRNISLLTIAPTGTTSLMTQTTSGIEPVFLPFYKRRRKVNPNDKNVSLDYKDEVGDFWEEYYVFHHKFLYWCEVNGHNRDEVIKMKAEQLNELVMTSPYFKATSNDIDWVAKVKMQGRMQKWVDHSISVTVNLPKDVTEELVSDVYKTAWEYGCKGVTVYRDGSRSGVLVATKENEGNESVIKVKERPKSLEAEVIRFKNGAEQWIALVGLMNGQPYEIFTGLIDEDTRSIPKSVTMGFIVKEKDDAGNTRYDFQFVDRYGYHNTIGGISHMFNKEFWNYAKLISGVLRNGMPITDVVNLVSGLQLDNEAINNWKNGVERALKRYI
ncbi:MAG: adenosylcobalamin-dependent ribonucleoside-diphosphate reductase, partial [Bacteroidales bacterium]|nr:adenosylcobalamin-dependent ribonucleoside-diphosphate reductase [Bacteroidales bacterium]